MAFESIYVPFDVGQDRKLPETINRRSTRNVPALEPGQYVFDSRFAGIRILQRMAPCKVMVNLTDSELTAAAPLNQE